MNILCGYYSEAKRETCLKVRGHCKDNGGNAHFRDEEPVKGAGPFSRKDYERVQWLLRFPVTKPAQKRTI